MRRLLLTAALLAGLTVTAAPAGAATTAKPSGCAAGPKRVIKFNVTGSRELRRFYYINGKVQPDPPKKLRTNIRVASLGLVIRACRTKGTKVWRTLDVYPAGDLGAMQRDLITTITPSGDSYKISSKPRTGIWGMGAYLGGRTDNAVTATSAVCSKEPASVGDVALSAAHGLLGLPVPAPVGGLAGVAFEIGTYAVDAALPEAGPDKFLCADGGGSVQLPWAFRPNGTVKHVLKKPVYTTTTSGRACTINVNPRYDSCSEVTYTTWTYKKA